MQCGQRMIFDLPWLLPSTPYFTNDVAILGLDDAEVCLPEREGVVL